jgi:hypothetical protein
MNKLRELFIGNIITGVTILIFQLYRVLFEHRPLSKNGVLVAFVLIMIGLFGQFRVKNKN